MNWKNKMRNRKINNDNVKVGDMVLMIEDPGNCANLVGSEVKIEKINVFNGGIYFNNGRFGYFKRFEKVF